MAPPPPHLSVAATNVVPLGLTEFGDEQYRNPASPLDDSDFGGNCDQYGSLLSHEGDGLPNSSEHLFTPQRSKSPKP